MLQDVVLGVDVQSSKDGKCVVGLNNNTNNNNPQTTTTTTNNRATRRVNRRLTRNESRYHSGKNIFLSNYKEKNKVMGFCLHITILLQY